MSEPAADKLDTQESAGIYGPESAMFGAGARIGIGLEVGVGQPDGGRAIPSVLVEAGYQSLFGTSETVIIEGENTTRSSTLQLGYGWIAAQVQKGRFIAALGPSWGGGRAMVVEDMHLLSGKMVGGGVTGGLSMRLVDVDDFTGALGVFSGTLYDGSRWYPWGEVALVVSPVPMRRI